MNALAPMAAPPATAPAVAADAVVLSKAVVRSAQLMGFTQRDVAAALGLSEATTSRLFAGRYLLSAERAHEWELPSTPSASTPPSRRCWRSDDQ